MKVDLRTRGLEGLEQPGLHKEPHKPTMEGAICNAVQRVQEAHELKVDKRGIKKGDKRGITKAAEKLLLSSPT